MKSYLKLIRYILKTLIGYINLFSIIPPYEYVQHINNQSIHTFLGLEKKELRNWVIVGGYLGHEVPTILRNYPNCKVTIFECSNRYIKKINAKFQNNNRVQIVNKAVSNEKGKTSFYETNLRGSGSLLKVSTLSKDSYCMEQQENFYVECTTLDDFFKNEKIDVLQLDVQGAELKVIDGAKKILQETKAIFTEISIKGELYENAVIFDEIVERLKKNSFQLCLLGTDFNLTGNALFIKNKNSS